MQDCISIATSSVCSPWTQYSINKTELSLQYNVEINAISDWQQLISQRTFLLCDNQTIQFQRTFNCFSDIFISSSGCNNAFPNPMICRNICGIYADAVSSLLNDCDVDSNFNSIVSSRDNLFHTESHCFSTIDNYTKDSCNNNSIIGVDSDIYTCGFSDKSIANEFCLDFPESKCCALIRQEPIKIQSLNANTAPEFQPLSTSSTLLITVGSIAFSLLVLLLLGFMYARFRYQRVSNTTPKMTVVTDKYLVIHDYQKTLPDEIELKRGEFVVVKSIFDDGWAKGVNVTTGLEGTFPSVCLEVKLV